MSKHTPGPWNCNRASSAGRNIIVSESMPLDIAVLSNRDKTQSEIDANARVIAAAPELLEALSKINDAACYASEENTDAMKEALLLIGNLARAAIAKAEGQA